MQPTIGRIVHYVSYGTPGGEYPSVCRAAIVTAVDEYQGSADGQFIGHVSLCVLNPEGQFFNKAVLQDEDTKAGGTWHWPEPAPVPDTPANRAQAWIEGDDSTRKPVPPKE